MEIEDRELRDRIQSTANHIRRSRIRRTSTPDWRSVSRSRDWDCQRDWDGRGSGLIHDDATPAAAPTDEHTEVLGRVKAALASARRIRGLDPTCALPLLARYRSGHGRRMSSAGVRDPGQFDGAATLDASARAVLCYHPRSYPFIVL
jgi:hypothetical protein